MIRLTTLGSIDLRTPGDQELQPILKGPKRLALLVYLASAAPGEYHRRDSLLALLWPESNDRQARGSLRNTLHTLRKHLGPDVLENSGTDQLRIAPGTLSSDTSAFREAVAAGRLTEALDLYRGEFLEGFHLPGAPGFQDWLDRERASLNRMAVKTAWQLAEEAEGSGDNTGATNYARQAVSLCDLDEQAIRNLIEFLDRLGDRAGALAAFDNFSRRLQVELLGEPAPETIALVERIRGRRHLHEEPGPTIEGSTGPVPPAGPVEVPTTPSAPEHDQAPLPDISEPEPIEPGADAASIPPGQPGQAQPSVVKGTSLPQWLRVGAVALIVLVGLSLMLRTRATLRGAGPIPRQISLAIGEIEAFGADSETSAASVLPGLLSTNLARVEGIRVFSRSHLSDLLASYDSAASPWRAAREIGADHLIEGTLIRREGDLLRIDLRQIDLETGEVSAAYSVEGNDPFSLVDQATAQLLDAFGLTHPATGIAEVSTHSLLAYRLYEEGVRAYIDGDNRTAHRLLSSALLEDSAFAMAAYYRAQTNRSIDHRAFRDDLHLAARLADQATDIERLRIRAAWSQAMDEPAQGIFADSLVQRFPNEPDGHLYVGKAKLWSGDFLAAMPHLDQVLELDSISLHGTRASCLACDAIADIVVGYLLADSLPAAERTARRWTDLQPGSARAWQLLGSSLEYQGRTTAAQAARNRASELRSGNPRDPIFPAVLALRAGEFERADRLISELDAAGSSLVQQNVLWYRVLSLIYQGRPEEALAPARAYTGILKEAAATGHSIAWPEVLEAIVLEEMGRSAEAAALWERMAEPTFEPVSPARSARHRAWTLTHAATALASAGRYERLPELADEIEELGSQSAFGRDPRLHHYVRGLIHAAEGDTMAAASAYREAIFSTTNGYARINFELGRSLLALGEAREAAEILGAALRGPLDAGNLYISRTEIHELAGRAWEAAGVADSAAAHYQWVDNARRGNGNAKASPRQVGANLTESLIRADR